MAIYNITNATDTTNLLLLTQEINILSEQTFGWMFLITFGALIFIGINKFTQTENDVAIAATLWSTAIFSLFLRAMDLIKDSAMIVTMLLAIVSVGFLYATNRK